MKTREEAIALLNEQYETCKRIYDCSADQRKSYPNVPQFMEALDLALSALRPVSQEQVEKVWRGYWEHDEISSKKSKTGKFLLPTCSCSKCGAYVQQEANFCPVCGDAKTDEAVQMVMERLNKLEETKK